MLKIYKFNHGNAESNLDLPYILLYWVDIIILCVDIIIIDITIQPQNFGNNVNTFHSGWHVSEKRRGRGSV